MIALDASVVIALFDRGDAHHERAVEVLSSVVDPLAMSTVTCAEVLVSAVRQGRAAALRSAMDAEGVEVVPLAAADAVTLAELRAATGLKLPDCCVILAAGADGTIATFDDRLAAAARARGLGVIGRPGS